MDRGVTTSVLTSVDRGVSSPFLLLSSLDRGVITSVLFSVDRGVLTSVLSSVDRGVITSVLSSVDRGVLTSVLSSFLATRYLTKNTIEVRISFDSKQTHAKYFLKYEARNHVHEKNVCLRGRSGLSSLLPVGVRGMVPVISVSIHWSVVVVWEPSLGLWACIAMFWGLKALFLGTSWF